MGNAISEKSCSYYYFFYFRELNSHLQQKLEDTSLELQEVRSLCNAATVERDRLAELVEVLQKRFFFVLRACLFFTVSCLVSGRRNKELVLSTTEGEQEMLQIRRRNVDLEKKLAKTKITQSGKRYPTQRSLIVNTR